MASAGRSLRTMVEDWMAPDTAKGVKVRKFGRSKNGRYVCIEAVNAAGPIAIFFFRHRDGTWCIFPPSAERPAMRVAEVSLIQT
ncbi:hypothetical protein FAZ95_07790 [Trinickia violacea]|uniref:Uncharacterized protein n=1 Tax=Trinickia violacea TaxID=2571746 RepID=A0A4P8ITC9_9BURK|nr:hypothetical protein [Trinickia violacea]QCP49089.1 hypothetical protein FAZ95_07790 [Trinickia violacea]